MFDENDVNNILLYMKVRKLPFIFEEFNAVKNKYMKGEIDMSEYSDFDELPKVIKIKI